MQDKSDFLLFVGRFHPLIVHLPIGLLAVHPLLELAAWKLKKPGLDTACRINLGLCAASAVGAVIVGLCLASNGSYGGDSFALHKKLGFALAAVLCLAAWLRCLNRDERKPLAAWGLTALGLGLLSPVGHMGGNLTHGPTWLTEYAPAWLPIPGKEEVKPDASNNPWLATVKPILEKNCTECHSGKEAKGDCNLEDPKLLFASGKSGKPGIVPGQPEQSEVLRRILLPAGHPDAMPTEGKKPLKPDEVLAISHWIAAGAPFEAAKAGPEATPATPASLQGLAAAGAYLRPLADGSPLLCADFTRPGCKLPEALAALPAAASRIAELKLARSAVSDADLEALPALPELTQLDLAATAVSAKGLASLSRHPKLRALNLAATATDDSAALGLAGIKSLRRVNLANAKVSKDGAKELRLARSGEEAITVICPAPAVKLSDKAAWSLVKVSSQETNFTLGAYPARQAIDGKPETLWTTRYMGRNDQPPHEIILDLGESTSFQGLKLLARQDGNPNGISAKIEISVSDDPKVFKEPLLVAEPWKGAQTAQDWMPQRQVRFPQAAQGRYLKLVFSADIRGNPWATLAELDLIQE
ncbi:MAG: hypothetical protein RL095_3706 [Verrucomicrobiota bacterium]|jgi:uncharacterized membrane protein